MPGLRRHSVTQGYLNKIGAIFKKTVLGKSKSNWEEEAGRQEGRQHCHCGVENWNMDSSQVGKMKLFQDSA